MKTFGGIALESEGERCAKLLKDKNIQILVMGNHGILVFGNTVCEAFNRMYYFEKAAQNYIRALQTNRPLRIMSEKIAKKVSKDLNEYYKNYKHLDALKMILDKEGSDYAN
jgi:Ribulose-5-phosphate 4-epimerase and related epimerases and aldolases